MLEEKINNMTTTMRSKRTYPPNPRTLKIIKRYYKQHPGASIYACAKQLRIDHKTVKRYRAMIDVYNKQIGGV